MASGINAPIQPSQRGGLLIARGSEYIAELIEVAHNDCDNLNPFQQDLGIGPQAIFANMEDMAYRAWFRAKHRDIMKHFEDLNLAKSNQLYFSDEMTDEQKEELEVEDNDGEITVVIRYINLEENRQEQVTITDLRSV